MKKIRKTSERDLRKETIAILIEKVEDLIELGDLILGEYLSCHFFYGRDLTSKEISKRKKQEEMEKSVILFVANASRSVELCT